MSTQTMIRESDVVFKTTAGNGNNLWFINNYGIIEIPVEYMVEVASMDTKEVFYKFGVTPQQIPVNLHKWRGTLFSSGYCYYQIVNNLIFGEKVIKFDYLTSEFVPNKTKIAAAFPNVSTRVGSPIHPTTVVEFGFIRTEEVADRRQQMNQDSILPDFTKPNTERMVAQPGSEAVWDKTAIEESVGGKVNWNNDCFKQSIVYPQPFNQSQHPYPQTTVGKLFDNPKYSVELISGGITIMDRKYGGTLVITTKVLSSLLDVVNALGQIEDLILEGNNKIHIMESNMLSFGGPVKTSLHFENVNINSNNKPINFSGACRLIDVNIGEGYFINNHLLSNK